jgi:hypothetical protein
MIAFVGPSSLTVSATDTVDDRELCMVLDIKLGSKIGTVLDIEPSTVVVHHIKLGSKLETFLEVDIKPDYKVGTVLDRRLLTVVVLDINLGSTSLARTWTSTQILFQYSKHVESYTPNFQLYPIFSPYQPPS